MGNSMKNINIFDAIDNNDINKVKKYMDHNGDVYIKGRYGETPLHYAAKSGRDVIVEYLITNDVDVNIKTYKELTPLHYAANNGHYATVQCLIANGANVNIKNEKGYTPLHLAVEKEHVDIVKYLTTNGADVNFQCESGLTPLHWVAKFGRHNSMVKYLIANGADITIQDNHGQTPLDSAINCWVYTTEQVPKFINIIKILLPLTNLTCIKDSYKLYKCKLNTNVEGKEGVMNDLIMFREYERYFIFCELFSIGTNPVDEDNNKQEKNSLMIGYDAPLDDNEEEEVRPFPPMFDSKLDDSLFDVTLVGEIWDYARDFLREDEINNYIEEEKL